MDSKLKFGAYPPAFVSSLLSSSTFLSPVTLDFHEMASFIISYTWVRPWDTCLFLSGFFTWYSVLWVLPCCHECCHLFPFGTIPVSMWMLHETVFHWSSVVVQLLPWLRRFDKSCMAVVQSWSYCLTNWFQFFFVYTQYWDSWITYYFSF